MRNWGARGLPLPAKPPKSTIPLLDSRKPKTSGGSNRGKSTGSRLFRQKGQLGVFPGLGGEETGSPLWGTFSPQQEQHPVEGASDSGKVGSVEPFSNRLAGRRAQQASGGRRKAPNARKARVLMHRMNTERLLGVRISTLYPNRPREKAKHLPRPYSQPSRGKPNPHFPPSQATPPCSKGHLGWSRGLSAHANTFKQMRYSLAWLFEGPGPNQAPSLTPGRN